MARQQAVSPSRIRPWARLPTCGGRRARHQEPWARRSCCPSRSRRTFAGTNAAACCGCGCANTPSRPRRRSNGHHARELRAGRGRLPPQSRGEPAPLRACPWQPGPQQTPLGVRRLREARDQRPPTSANGSQCVVPAAQLTAGGQAAQSWRDAQSRPGRATVRPADGLARRSDARGGHEHHSGPTSQSHARAALDHGCAWLDLEAARAGGFAVRP